MPVALFTLEMSKAEVTQRLMCAEGKVESQRLRTGKLAVDDWPRLTAACDKLAKAPIYVDDTGSITMMEIRSKLRRLKMTRAEARPRDRRLPAADDERHVGREPRAGGVADLARAEGARARPRGADHRALAALARRRAAARQAADPLRPARVRLDRAGRRPRDVRLPRRVLQPGGDRVRGHRRADPRQAPQRRDRHREARVPEALREVRRPGGRAA